MERYMCCHIVLLDNSRPTGVLNHFLEGSMSAESQDIQLRFKTPDAWAQMVVADIDAFMQDHAHQERKVCTSALKLASHHPNRMALVDSMIELAREELKHFKQVVDILQSRGKTMGYDEPDPYLGPMVRMIRERDHEAYLLSRLLLFAIVEARGCERFQMVADSLLEEPLKDFYGRLAQSEIRHKELFLDLAHRYFDSEQVDARLDELLDLEAQVVSQLKLRSALH
jgi:tRNA-(ms[2]io[6]A)-hydroxylase